MFKLRETRSLLGVTLAGLLAATASLGVGTPLALAGGGGSGWSAPQQALALQGPPASLPPLMSVAAPPTVSSVSPNQASAAGGTQTTGTGFTGATAVCCRTAPPSPPPNPQPLCLPMTASVSPSGGPTTGGTTVTITVYCLASLGTFQNPPPGEGPPPPPLSPLKVYFGPNLATNVGIVSTNQVEVTSPAGSGTVDVTVEGPNGTTPVGTNDTFTYNLPYVTFTDLGGWAWAQNAIDTLAKEGIIHGVGNGQYDPGGNVTRAQFACLMQHAFALPQPASPIAFADVPRNSWQYPCVGAGAAYFDYYQLPGGGYAFHPDQGFDRQDVATVIVRILVKSGKLQLASSAQTQALLAKVTDASNIAPNLAPYVATAIQAGIMAGFPDGSFQPQTLLNRAQVAAVLLKLQNYFVTTGS
ncbi:MAG: S-layer homology domain-containing protein [Thermaerobacter sp.]|nr:S-layer homology domain-containing protein [Thermaerobacter sp.]